MAPPRAPFRADHVGSLLRPPALKTLRLDAVLGLVTTKVGTLERKADLRRRLDEASRYIPMDQLGVSPQCGFSSTIEGNAVALEHQWAKLALCVELATEVWGGL